MRIEINSDMTLISIDGLKLDDNSDDVQTMWGNPQDTFEKRKYNLVILKYGQLQVTLYDKEVYQIAFRCWSDSHDNNFELSIGQAKYALSDCTETELLRIADIHGLKVVIAPNQLDKEIEEICFNNRLFFAFMENRLQFIQLINRER